MWVPRNNNRRNIIFHAVLSRWFRSTVRPLYDSAIADVANFVGADPNNLVFVQVCKKSRTSRKLIFICCRMPLLPSIQFWRISFWDLKWVPEKEDEKFYELFLFPGHNSVQLTQLQCVQQCNRISDQTMQCWHAVLGSKVDSSATFQTCILSNPTYFTILHTFQSCILFNPAYFSILHTF